MVRLSRIKPETLEEIEKYVKSQRMVIPVVSKGENLIDKVEEKFNYRLSPQQIYELQKGRKTYRIKLTPEIASDIMEKYGSMEYALTRLAQVGLPPHLKYLQGAYDKLLQRRKVKMTEVDELLGENSQKILSELARAGYLYREGDYFIVTRAPYNPILDRLRDVTI